VRPNLRVATWNLGESRLCNLPAVAQAIRAVNADLVFLNEVMRGDVWADARYGVNSALDLQARCGYPFIQWIDTSILSPIVGSGAKMVALFSRFPLFSPYPQPALEDPIANGVFRALEVQAEIDGRIWFLYTLRFSSRNFDNFSRHCELLRDRIRALPAGTPVIAAGDFNGGAHHYKTWRENGRQNPTVVQNGPPPQLADLIRQAGLSSVTERWPLRPAQPNEENPIDSLPPHYAATDLILFRGDIEAVNSFETLPNCGCVDAFVTAKQPISIGPDHEMVVGDFAPKGTSATLQLVDQLLLTPKRIAKPIRKPIRKPRIRRPAR
jgi:endonuclease/exonuclease/phosphatase family metal-dependent hydrolase